ncbi:MAG: DUF1257 domain-containing protein [bacterium]
MSHVVEVRTEIRDREALMLACQRLGLSPPVSGTVRLFSSEATGEAVQLPGWRYPVVCDLVSGQVKYDNYEGCWGDPKELNRLLQAYAVEKARLEAVRKGYLVTEQPLADGSIRLTVKVGGAA